MSNRREPDTFTTSLGTTVEIVGVSPFEIDEIGNTVPLPAVPTRKVETAVPGYVEEQELTADTLLDDEERAAWAEYRKRLEKAVKERGELVTNFVFLEGTRFEMDKLEAWKAKRKRWKLPIPEDEIELQILYYRTAIIGGRDDIDGILRKVMAKAGVDEATLRQVQSTFQRPLRRDAAGAAQGAARQVELQPAVPGDEGSEGVGGVAAE